MLELGNAILKFGGIGLAYGMPVLLLAFVFWIAIYLNIAGFKELHDKMERILFSVIGGFLVFVGFVIWLFLFPAMDCEYNSWPWHDLMDNPVVCAEQ